MTIIRPGMQKTVFRAFFVRRKRLGNRYVTYRQHLPVPGVEQGDAELETASACTTPQRNYGRMHLASGSPLPGPGVVQGDAELE